ncbi:potassium channel family protein [Blastococcus brunescens]|uniref:Potassium channel family protein n=1 Tax=Blastococcus brunescens TaxID=1564165 RepID=A0ABZ1AU54_9ACTN|nr:potassium channel family protein [Blastococcus sp. BMG 8361]WRL62113.1 potassium channel family protein [Blastococcus sp. BMG 8361]
MAYWADWLITGAGVVLVLVALRDIFHTIWHPSGRGDLSHLVMRGLWRLGQRRRERGTAGVLTGPIALALVIGMWLLLLIGGGALVYAPHLPEGFVYQSGLDVSERSQVLDAVYLSTVTLATLGFGDIVPAAGWLRIAVPVQALIGFALLTGSVTWVLQVYPALIRRRSLAVRLAQLRTVPAEDLLHDPGSTLAAPLLDGLAGGLVQARVDVTQYNETYYFRDGMEDASLPAMLSVASRLGAAGRLAPRKDVRLAAGLLATAIDDFAHVLDEQFLGVGGSTADILTAYARAHHHGGEG